MTLKPIPECKCFPNLSEAVAFIASCLESEGREELRSQLESAQDHLNRKTDSPDSFSRYIFEPLREIHQRTDLRELYSEREFPEGDTQFKLGGHMQELGCIHIDFAKGERGWSLRDIWLCR